MTNTRCRLSIRVASRTLQSANLATIFGEPPFRRVNVGEPISPRVPALAKVSSCIWRAPLEPTSGPDQHIDWLVRLLETASPHMATYQDLEVSVRLSISPGSGQTCFAIPGRGLRVLAAFDAQFNIDLYTDDEDDP